MRPKRRAAAFVACVALGGAVGCDAAHTTSAGQGTGAPRAVASSDPSEGGATAAIVFVRAQRAVAESDDRAFVLTLRPATRDLWLRDLVVDIAIESSDPPIDSDEERVRRARYRSVLARFGAKLTARPTSLSKLGDALLDRVRDRVGLFAALLELARTDGSPFDPVRALTQATSTTSTGLPIVRLVERVRAPAALTELSAPAVAASSAAPNASSSASASAAAAPAPAPSAAGEGASVVFVTAASGALPLRLWSDGVTVWLDES